jgi:hypothetical protein
MVMRPVLSGSTSTIEPKLMRARMRAAAVSEGAIEAAAALCSATRAIVRPYTQRSWPFLITMPPATCSRKRTGSASRPFSSRRNG